MHISEIRATPNNLGNLKMFTRIDEGGAMAIENIEDWCDGCGAPYRRIEGVEDGITSTHPPTCPTILRLLPASDRPIAHHPHTPAALAYRDRKHQRHSGSQQRG